MSYSCTQKIESSDSLVVSVDDIKKYLRIKNDDEDDLLIDLIKSSIDYAEWYMERSLRIQKWKVIMYDCAPQKINLSFGPVTRIDKISVFNKDVERQINDMEYHLESNCDLLYIYSFLVGERIEIEYFAGYSDISMIPAQIRQGIINHISVSYYSRSNNFARNNLALTKELYNQFSSVRLVL